MTKTKRFFYRFMAELIFWVHVAAGAVLLFFWQYESLYFVYVAVLTVAVLDNSFLDFCFLAKWECYFRKKLDPTLDFDTFFGYYFTKFFGLRLNPKQVHKAVLVTLWCLVGINITYWLYVYART